MEALAVAGFFALKLLIYACWCWLGLRVLSAEPRRWRRAAAHGLLRVLLGLALGWTLVFVLSFVAPASNRLGLALVPMALYMLILRWFIWSVVGASLLRRGWTLRGIFGGTARQQAWRIGGVLLSLATDVAALFGISALGMIPC